MQLAESPRYNGLSNLFQGTAVKVPMWGNACQPAWTRRICSPNAPHRRGVPKIMKNVLILGASGMLGSMLLDVLSRANDLAVTASVRDASLRERLAQLYPRVRWVQFRFYREVADPAQFAIFREQDWIINAIGIT